MLGVQKYTLQKFIEEATQHTHTHSAQFFVAHWQRGVCVTCDFDAAASLTVVVCCRAKVDYVCLCVWVSVSVCECVLAVCVHFICLPIYPTPLCPPALAQ